MNNDIDFEKVINEVAADTSPATPKPNVSKAVVKRLNNGRGKTKRRQFSSKCLKLTVANSIFSCSECLLLFT